MAASLTEDLRVAWKIQGVGPDPTHALAIFKKNGTGSVLHKMLEPGQTFRRWFGSLDSYHAYSISTEENLRHTFSRKYQAVNQTWTFTLHFALDFKVARPKVLALKLDRSDPVRRLEEEVAMVLSATARRLSWEALEVEGPSFSLRLLEAESTEGLGERTLNFVRLISFAENLGLQLRNVGVTRSLSEGDLRPVIRKREVGIQLEVKVADHTLAKGEELLLHDSELLKDHHRQERELLKENHRQERERLALHGNQILQGAERLKLVLDSLTKEGLRGFSQAVDGVRSFPAIADALGEVQAIQASLMKLSSVPAFPLSSPDNEANPLAGSQAVPILTEARHPLDPLERFVGDAFQHLRSLDENPADKRLLLAISLHILAEASIGNEGDEEFLIGCSESLKRQIYPLESILGVGPLDFFNRIMNVDELRQDLRLETR